MSTVDLSQFAANSSVDDQQTPAAQNAAAPVSTSNGPKIIDPKTGVKKKKKGSFLKKILIFLLIVLLLLAGLGVAGWFFGKKEYVKVQAMQVKMQEVKDSAKGVADALKTQNLTEATKKIQETKTKYAELRTMYAQFSWVEKAPCISNPPAFLGEYKGLACPKLFYQDGLHALAAGEAGLEAAEIGVGAITPYADVLGFAGEGTFTGGSVDNRIQLMLATLSKVAPEIDKLSGKLDVAGKELAQIDENRYPVEVRGYKVRELIAQAKSMSAGASQAIVEARPVLDVLPDVAGANGKRKRYFILFQNDNELRPTGGFMTAFATVFVENGRVTPERSEDIYELDKKFANKPPIPDILKQYLTTEKRWNLRDMNIDPDFKTSMETFWKYYSKLPGEDTKNIDGIIAVDTNVLEQLVAILGPVKVGDYGTFTAEKDKRCDCPQIIYALSEIVDRPTSYVRENRKGIIGPMMQGILGKAYDAPHQQWPALFQSGWGAIQAKHVQFYFFDPKVQAAAEAVNSAGRMRAPKEGQDYLNIVDTNLGGAKSNLFVTSAFEQEVSVPSNGVLEKSITMTYRNPFKASNCNLEAGQLCLNAKLFNWQRVYLPKGAVLKESTGYADGSVKTREEGDYTIIEGVFTVDPMAQSKVKLSYTIPFKNEKEYSIYMQKQAGTPNFTHLMRVNGGEHEVILDKDQTFTTAF